MFFSTNPGLFRHPQLCALDNGTTVFYDTETKFLDCNCLAQIRADPDFAGPGVIASYLFIGWLTVLVAAVPAFYTIYKHWRSTKTLKGSARVYEFVGNILQFEKLHAHRSRPNTPPADSHCSHDSFPTTLSDDKEKAKLPESVSSEPDDEPAFCIWMRQLLQPLCDLQIITGLAMLVAALSQLPRLTFYHQQFAVQFWWVTLNSFWVSRIDYSRNTPEMRTWKAHARRVTIWVSVMLSIATQAVVAIREKNQWEPTTMGRCYVASGVGNNFGQNIFWLAGTCIYAIVLTISLTNPSRRWWDKNVNLKLEPSARLMRSWANDAHARTLAYQQNSTLRSSHSKPRQYVTIALLHVRTASYVLAWLTWWALVQFLSIWCAGNTSSTIELITYSIFLGFLTWWILFLKIQNLPLIRGDEGKWTVGQTLPVLLVLLIVFNSLDVWSQVKGHRKKRTEADTV